MAEKIKNTAAPAAATRKKKIPVHARERSKSTTAGLIALVVLLALLPFVFEALSQGIYTRILTLIGLYLILALGLNILVGYAGQLDFGRIAFYAVGAYAGMIVSTVVCNALPAAVGGLTFIVTILAGVAGAVVLGAILSAAVLRLRGDYLTIVTLGLAEIVRVCAQNNFLGLTHGAAGLSAPNGLMNPIGLKWLTNAIYFPINNNYSISFSSDIYWYLLILVFVVLAIIITRRQENSRTGRAWAALKDDDIAARAMGINTTKTKTSAIMMSAIWGGVAGALFACVQGLVSPETFTFFYSILVLAIVVIGGMGSTKGVIIGAFIIYGTPELIRAFAGESGLPFVMWQLTSTESFILVGLVLLLILAAIFVKGKKRRWAIGGLLALMVIELIRATIFGPLGAPLTQGVVSTISNYRNLVLGILMVVMMALRPDGIVPMVRPRRLLTSEAQKKLESIGADTTGTALEDDDLTEAGEAA